MQFINLKVRGRLILGFAAIILVLVAMVGSTMWKVRGINELTDDIVNLRTPTTHASSAIVNSINASLAALRGWMLTGNPEYIKERVAVWAEIAKDRRTMDELTKNWTNPKNVEAWTTFKTILDEFDEAQALVEETAHTPDEQPATKILRLEGAPRAAVIIREITRMIDEEQTLEATQERKNLLGMMADVRGTMGVLLANIHAYLLTGDAKFVENFKIHWAKNERRFNDLDDNQALMTETQRKSFEELSEARAEFAPLPAKMFEIRGSEKWNMANFLLVAKAAPRAEKLLEILAGSKQEDGSREGGMVENQKLLLSVDAKESAAEAASLLTMQWILLGLGIAFAMVITYFSSRSIVNPITKMTGAMNQLANGDLETEIPTHNNNDEIGDMAQALHVFKDNAIEKRGLERARENLLLELSTPVVKIWDKVLLMSLIGAVDDARASRIIETLLEAIVKLNARVTIIDVTGVPMIDTYVARHLMKTIAAAEMLGATVLVTGIGPEIAQSLVKLGIDLSSLRSCGPLRGGISEALRVTGHSVIRDLDDPRNRVAVAM